MWKVGKRKTRYKLFKAAHLRFGEKGERIAVRLVQSLGMEKLATNYKAPNGEIDIVAANLERVLGISGPHSKFGRRLGDCFQNQVSIQPDMLLFSINFRAGRFPTIQGLVVKKIDPDVLENTHRSVVDALDLPFR